MSRNYRKLTWDSHWITPFIYIIIHQFLVKGLVVVVRTGKTHFIQDTYLYLFI